MKNILKLLIIVSTSIVACNAQSVSSENQSTNETAAATDRIGSNINGVHLDKKIVKANTTDIISFDMSNNNSVNVSNKKELACHNTIPEWQAKELAEVPCLELPISNQDFLDIKKFDNSMFDIEGDTKYPKSQIYYKQILLGLIPYNDEETFLLSFSNDRAEDMYPNQSFHITKVRKDNEEGYLYTLDLYPLGLINYDFQDNELIKLGIDPNEFADIDFDTLGKENIQIDDICIMNFNIDINWHLTRSYTCPNSEADQESIDSFKEELGSEYQLVNTGIDINYERVD